MLGFGGAPMACSPALQAGNEFIVKIAHMQISAHPSPVRSLISMISPGICRTVAAFVSAVGTHIVDCFRACP